MSEKQDAFQQASSNHASPQSKKQLSLLNALIILAIIYLVCEIIPLFATIITSASLPWIELGQWVLIIIWLLVGVRPPFMRWLKQERARKG